MPNQTRHRSQTANRDVGVLLLAMLGAAALAAVVLFDFGPPLVFNDDWAYTAPVRQLSSGHGLQFPAEQQAVALFHVFWGAGLTLGHPDPRLLRLTLVPLVLLGAFSAFRLTRRLGADNFWSATAALAVAAGPINLALTTSFMTDAAYTGLLVTATWLAMRWWEEGDGMVPCIVLVVLATSERQIGLGVAVALSVALLLAPRRRRTGREGLALLALWLCLGAVILVPLVTLRTSAQGAALNGLGQHDLVRAGLTVLAFPGLLGLFLLPFMLATRPRVPRVDSPARVIGLVFAATVLVVLLAGIVVLYRPRGGAFTGDYFTASGLNPPHLGGQKVALYPAMVFWPLEGLAVATVLAAISWRAPICRIDGLGRRALFLLAIGATQLVPIIHVYVLDRYFLPLFAVIIPIAAGLASRHSSRASRWWAMGALAAFLALYIAGEQDYQAWQQARDRAARYALSLVPATRLSAGYEANVVYLYLPLRARDPASPLLPRVTGDTNPEVLGPPNPCIRLEFGAPDDPRPGVTYRSLAPGRVVLVVERLPCPDQPGS